MKPKLFVASSSEAIDLANAIHENLMPDDVEVTVWNQGIFQLSQPAVDSLLEKLDRMDFGAFVFAPDDKVLIRGEESNSTRDNVIFELGLFVGRLGRLQSFVFLPSDHQRFRLPSDLVGMMPAIYESDRSDKNPVSATAVACSQVRRRIKELWSGAEPEPATSQPKDEKINVERSSVDASEGESADQDDKASQETHWGQAYFDERDYEKAARLLEEEIEAAHGTEKYRLELWLGSVKAELDFDEGVQYLESKIEESSENYLGYLLLSWAYNDEDLYEDSFTVLERGLGSAADKSALTWAKANLLLRTDPEDTDEAKTILQQLINDYPRYVSAYMSLASVLEGEDESDQAKAVYELGLKKLPKNETLLAAYARLLLDLEENESALPVYKKLVALYPNNRDYLTFLGNVYLSLNLYGLALETYQEANTIAEDKVGWILGNIGNLYNNKDLYPQAIDFLKKALQLNPDSDYVADRLAKAIKADREEREEENKIIREQRGAARKLEQAKATTEEPTTEDPAPEE